MPTPARSATASRLASGPPALNTTFAADSTRSRLRTASARGFRTVSVVRSAIPVILITNRLPGTVLSLIPLSEHDLFGSLAPRIDHSSRGLLKTEDASAYGDGSQIWKGRRLIDPRRSSPDHSIDWS